MKTTLIGMYDTKNNAGANAIFHVNAGDVNLRASTFAALNADGPALTGFHLALENPGFFNVNYNVLNKGFQFQFMSRIRVAEKPLDINYSHYLTYSNGWQPISTSLGGTLMFDPANIVSANYMFGSRNCKLKYTYLHKGLTTFQPSYDVGDKSWDFAVSRKIYYDDRLTASFQRSTNTLGLQYSLNTKQNANFTVAASMKLEKELKLPHVSAQTVFNFDM